MTAPRVFDDYEKVAWLAGIIGEAETGALIRRHLEQVRPRLTSEHVQQLYDDRYVEILEAHPPALVVADTFPVNIYQAPVLRVLRRAYPRGTERVLDLGCGGGNFALALAALGFECHGVDYNPIAVRRAREAAARHSHRFRIPPVFHAADVNEQGLDLGVTFDVITLNDVAEHLAPAELISLLRACRAALGTGGRLYLHTPNGRCFYDWTEKTVKGRLVHFVVMRLRGHRISKGLEEGYYEQVHVNVMGPTALRDTALRAGFSRVAITYDEPFRISWLTDLFSGSMTAVLS